MIRLVVLTAVLALAACQTVKYAKEPIPLSSGARNFFAKYSALPTSGYFAVSEDGRSAGYTYCEDWAGCSGIGNAGEAIAVCEQYSRGVPCVIYAYAGKPLVDDKTLKVASVQNNQAPAATPKPAPAAVPASPPPAVVAPTAQPPAPTAMESRTIAVRWEGIAELMAGTVQFEERAGTGRVAFTFPDRSATCSGTFQAKDRASGAWSLACSNGKAASGSYKALGPGQGSVGEGKDVDGKAVQFTVGARG